MSQPDFRPRLTAIADLAIVFAGLSGVAAVLAAAGVVWPHTELSLVMLIGALSLSALTLILRRLGGEWAYLHGLPLPRRLTKAAWAALAVLLLSVSAVVALLVAASSLR